MFSKYKKPGGAATPAPGNPKPTMSAVTALVAEDSPRKSLMKSMPTRAAEVAPGDRDKKRKERLGEIKLELHKALLDNLNLAALENASENDLRNEINAITNETLDEMGIVLNRDERVTLSQDLFFEVKGLGPLETLLKDDTVNDILVNGPQQIFVERDGKLELTDITFKDEKHLLR
ncbi:MAG: pilus assembly protein CpaF, partial [Loktanella salsilacus]